MSQIVVARIVFQVTAQELLTIIDGTSVATQHDIGNFQKVLESVDRGSPPASGAPGVSVCYSDTITLDGSGDYDLDLTDLLDAESNAVDATDLDLHYYLFDSPTTNAGAVTVDSGVSNGYSYLNNGVDYDLNPGSYDASLYESNIGDVDSTHKIIHFDGTAGDTLNVVLLLG